MTTLPHTFARSIVAVATAVLLAACPTIADAAVDKVVVATWNAENLFDTEANQPNGGDAEFTPRVH